MDIDKKTLASYFDHTNLKPTATLADIQKLCDEALEWGFGAICINPCYLDFAVKYMQGKHFEGKIATVIGFPLGAMTPEAKLAELNDALLRGAEELDIVINIGQLKSGNYEYVLKELMVLVEAARTKPVKVIIETCYLTDEEKRMAIELVSKSGAQYIKTSTGFGPSGATLEDVKLMKELGGNLKIKAAGGVRTLQDALDYINAGVSRIGASASVSIMNEFVSS